MNKKFIALIFLSALMLLQPFSAYIMMPVSAIELTEAVYVGIADYYDNRKAVVTVTADDWQEGTDEYFENMSRMLAEKKIYYTGAINPGLNPNWTQIQYWLNQGYLEAASHSRSHKHLANYTENDYNSEINGSKADIISNLTLPSSYSYGGTEYVYSWIEPWGESDETVRQKLGYYGYLSDRRYQNGYSGLASWNSVDGLFNRIGQTIRMEDASGGVIDVATLNDAFDSAYNAGGIYHLMTHPDGVDWSENQYADLHTSYISGRNDVWYVSFGHLYLYHWIDSQNIVQVIPTAQNNVFRISIDSQNRQDYGAKYPITYVFDVPLDWTEVSVNYRFTETSDWAPLTTKTSSDFFNGVDAVRFDNLNHRIYVSIRLENTSNEIYLEIVQPNVHPGPIADFSATPTTGTEPLLVNFTDLSTSNDGIIGWIWDFGDGYYSTAQNPIHTYASNRTDQYSVVLRVLEEDGDEDVKTEINYITVADSFPTADFSYSPAPTPSTLIFTDQSTSHDNIVSWFWDFDDGKTSTQPNPTHKFPRRPRTFSITLHVTDADGSINSTTKPVTINNFPPKADFKIVSSDKPTINEVIYFIDNSLDPDGDVVSWFWDFGDGTTSISQNVTHGYQALGNYTVTLTITDDEGATDTISKDLTIFDVIPPTTTHNYDGIWHKTDFTIPLSVTDDLSGVKETYYKINDGPIRSVGVYGPPQITTEGANNRLEYWSIDNAGNEETHHTILNIKLDKTRPTAVAGMDQVVNEDTIFTFDGSFSNDNIGISNYTWSFFDRVPQTLTGENASYTFYTPGVYDVVLSVTDAALNEALDIITITVNDTTKPRADAGDDKVIQENTEVIFNGQASTDNVEIVSYVWTFLDGTPKTLHGVNPIYVFDNPGIYEITMKIFDEQGNSATDFVTFTIIDATWPSADAGLDQMVDAGTLVNFDGSASTDNVGITNYLWTFTDKTSQTLSTANPSYTFEMPGIYIVTLNVTDAQENFSVDTVLITVRDATPPTIIIENNTIVVENAVVNFDASKSYDNIGIAYYQWNFGDGTVENNTRPSTTHTYTKSGVYSLKLTLTDQAGNINSSSFSIDVYRDTDGDLLADYIDEDDDNDGMPDKWEISYKLDPLDPSDSSLDPDGDNLKNLEEFQWNSDPKSYTLFGFFPLGDIVKSIIIFVLILFLITSIIQKTQARFKIPTKPDSF
jgi:PKD repeat protein